MYIQKYVQVKDAKDRFNKKAGPNDIKLSLIKIFTKTFSHIIAVRDEATDNRYPVYFKCKDTDDPTEHDNG